MNTITSGNNEMMSIVSNGRTKENKPNVENFFRNLFIPAKFKLNRKRARLKRKLPFIFRFIIIKFLQYLFNNLFKAQFFFLIIT